MDFTEVSGDREFVCRLDHGRDWRGQIEDFAGEMGINAGFFIGLGAVQDATVLFYDQDTTTYEPVTFDEPLEVTSCIGNISWLDDERFAHTHVTLSRPDGTTVAGHLDTATTFAGELYIRTFTSSLKRTHDPTTDLDLWSM